MVRQAVSAIARALRAPMNAAAQPGRWKAWAPAGLVAIAVIFNLVVLRAETTQVPNLNDGVLHNAMMRVALHDIDQGRLPLGGWFPYLSLGSAQFLHYQSLPHVIGALVGTVVGTANVYYWSLYLLLALWPVSVFVGARLLGWNPWTAGIAALLSPLLVSVAGYGYQDSSYTWSGYGVWTQLWGMWLLPLAWGLSWRAVNHGRNYALAALAIAVTIACHFLTGYLALLVLVPWVLSDVSQLRRRLLRAAAVGGGALLIAAWVLVPLVSEAGWSGNLEFYRGTFFFDSYGAPQVLGWLFTGQLYDSGRFPIVSLLVGVGLVVCIARVRRDTRSRALIGAWLLSLVLYFGRPTLGPLLNVLPGGSDLPLHRYINGVHLAGLMLAGVGALWIAQVLLAGLRRLIPGVRLSAGAAGVAVVGLALLYPGLEPGRRLQRGRSSPDVGATVGGRHRRRRPGSAHQPGQDGGGRTRLRGDPSQLGPGLHRRKQARVLRAGERRHRRRRCMAEHRVDLIRPGGTFRRDQPRRLRPVQHQVPDPAAGSCTTGSGVSAGSQWSPHVVGGGHERLPRGRRHHFATDQLRTATTSDRRWRTSWSRKRCST